MRSEAGAPTATITVYAMTPEPAIRASAALAKLVEENTEAGELPHAIRRRRSFRPAHDGDGRYV